MSKIIAGIDEAGRGPVLGPIVMVAVSIKEENLQKLEWMGVKDSKLLTKLVREEIFEQIRDVIEDFRVEVIEPDAIDLSVKSDESNLNWLEADTSARIVSELNPDKIIVDCPSINLLAYRNYFLDRLSSDVRSKAELVVEHKADLNYVVVAAASVVAKVIRDRLVDKQKNEIGIDFGSGYMSDPKTQRFLSEYSSEYAHLFRKSWKSYQKVEDAKKQRSLDEF